MEHIYQQVKTLSDHISIMTKEHRLFNGILELNMLCIQYMRAFDENQHDNLSSLISQIQPLVDPYVQNVLKIYNTISDEIKEKCLMYKENCGNSELLQQYIHKRRVYYCAVDKYYKHNDLTALMDMKSAIEEIKNVLAVQWISTTREFQIQYDF
jgi:hypothetical protein